MTEKMKAQAIKELAKDLKKQDPKRVDILMEDLNGDPKTERLTLRVTPGEKAFIQKCAKRRRQTVSGYVLTAVEAFE